MFAAAASGAVLVGCNQHSTSETIDDAQWVNGELRAIVNRAHYVQPMFSFHGGGTMTKQEWVWVALSSQGQSKLRDQKREFLSGAGGYDHAFLLATGTGFLIHNFQPTGSDGHCTLFDAKTGKDISEPFPAAYLFNRSRTACVSLIGGKAVILDTLSAKTGAPKVLSQPPWEAPLGRLKFGRLKPVLTDDLQYLVLLPSIESPSYVTSSNFVVEVFSTNGSREHWSIPLERNWETFVDAESVHGEVLLVSRRLLDNGAQDEVKLISMQGATLFSAKVSAFSGTPLWDPANQEMLFPPSEVSFTHLKSTDEFYLWQYPSNALRKILLRN